MSNRTRLYGAASLASPSRARRLPLSKPDNCGSTIGFHALLYHTCGLSHYKEAEEQQQDGKRALRCTLWCGHRYNKVAIHRRAATKLDGRSYTRIPEERSQVDRSPPRPVIAVAIIAVARRVENLIAMIVVPFSLVSVAQHGVGMLQLLEPDLRLCLVAQLPQMSGRLITATRPTLKLLPPLPLSIHHCHPLMLVRPLGATAIEQQCTSSDRQHSNSLGKVKGCADLEPSKCRQPPTSAMRH